MPQTNKLGQKCVVCDETITNPICLLCLEKEMIQWISTRKPGIIDAIKSRTDIFYDLVNTGINCIVCGNKMNVCSHCYCMEMLDWFNKEHSELADEFADIFNFEITQPWMTS